MSCVACGRESPPDARFCMFCGQALERRCSACQAPLPEEARFCPSCGRGAEDPRSYTPRHLAERILTTRASLEGERKHVTVLFADVADSTALAERLGPDAMHALMDRCFQHLLEPVHRYEGTVNQFTGDGIMALFGAPLALEDAPRRAVLAALGIQRALQPLDREVRERIGRPFRMRIGIHTGPVVVGRIGDDLRMDYTAVGDTTNLAARLEQTAEPGSILISDATEHQVTGFFELEDLGALGLKGKTSPVHAFRVVRERAVSGRIEAEAEKGLTPLVGRARELEALRAAFESAREGRGQVVFLVGEAGLGKSRLLHEFRRSLADEAHVWIEGRCASWARDSAFHPIVDGLRRRFGIEDRDDDAAAVAKMERAESERGGELAWTLPFVRHFLSLPAGDPAVAEMDAPQRRSETFRALQARILRAAELRPVLVVVEDLHWIDAASEEFLTFLADSIPATRALLVFTHRPGYRHPFGDRSYHVRVALQTLSEREMAAMAGSLLANADLPEGLRRLIAGKAEGNPFFVEEITKSLLEQGVLRVADGRVELTRDLRDVSVPDRIQDVLMARIDRLPDEPKRAIQVASVIGREFALRLLERIQAAGTRTRQVVEELRALELIYEKATHPELAFMFKHALTHDVAYESVLVERRKALHRIVGGAIEELYRDRLAEQYEALAHHFTQGEDWELALRYHELAAEKAAAAFANRSAARHCREALAIAERLGDAVPEEQRRRLEERLGRVCFVLSEFAASGEAYERAARLPGDRAASARNLGRASYGFLWAHDYERTRRVTDEGLALARACGSDAARSILLTTEFEHAMVAGRAEAPGFLDEAVALAERSGDAEATIRALIHRVQQHGWTSDWRRTLETGDRVVALATREGLPEFAAHAFWFMGLSWCGLGRYDRAVALLQESVTVCDRLGDRAFKARLLNSLGWCFAEFGCHERAAAYNRGCNELAEEMVKLALVPGAPELYANGKINLAGNRVALGDAEGALEELAPVRAELAGPGDPWMKWRYTLHLEDVLARVDLARGDAEAALARTQRELEGARHHGARKLEARALELRGRTLVAMDAREEAARTLDEALALARAIEYPPVVWRALSLQAELARRHGRGGERLAAQGRALVERLAAPLPEPALRSQFLALGERLAADPLGASR